MSIRPLQFSLIYSPANVMSGRERESEFRVLHFWYGQWSHWKSSVCMPYKYGEKCARESVFASNVNQLVCFSMFKLKTFRKNMIWDWVWISRYDYTIYMLLFNQVPYIHVSHSTVLVRLTYNHIEYLYSLILNVIIYRVSMLQKWN